MEEPKEQQLQQHFQQLQQLQPQSNSQGRYVFSLNGKTVVLGTVNVRRLRSALRPLLLGSWSETASTARYHELKIRNLDVFDFNGEMP